jgi:hypothetical protein
MMKEPKNHNLTLPIEKTINHIRTKVILLLYSQTDSSIIEKELNFFL